MKDPHILYSARVCLCQILCGLISPKEVIWIRKTFWFQRVPVFLDKWDWLVSNPVDDVKSKLKNVQNNMFES